MMKLAWFISLAMLTCGCSTLRTTDPPRTATEQYLLNEAARRSIDQLLTAPLRDRLVYVDTSFLIGSKYPAAEHLYLASELRAKLLGAGARITNNPDEAQVMVELRAVGVGIDRLETLFGIPSVSLSSGSSGTASVPLLTPELAIIKRLRQRGYASIAFVAYWRDSGEILASSGPFLGKTEREDFWILGFGPRTAGNIPPAKD